MRVLPFALTIFISAFLLFQVQPLISHFILPWFGGTPAVWSVALLFFQGGLLAGYGYAHLSIARLKPAVQLGVHVALLVLAAVTLPIIPPESFKPTGDENPTLRILLLLATSVGLPYLVLSATGPLLQAWFARANPGRSPYALYALSNVGSLLALVSYPFVFEPMWGRTEQATNWSWLFVGFAVVCALAALIAFKAKTAPEAAASAEAEKTDDRPAMPMRTRRFFWVAFPAMGTMLLMGYTNQLCVDVAAVPFLWVLPLSLYLLSFIITFAGPRWYIRPTMLGMFVVAIAATGIALWYSAELPILWTVGLYCVSLFITCIVCHGETYRLRPDASSLTRFYLSISLGGVIGGAFVALVAPLVFSLYAELPTALLATVVLVLVQMARDPRSKLYDGKPRWVWGVLLSLTLATIIGLGAAITYTLRESIHAGRNFYGVFRVDETPEGSNLPWLRDMLSGSTLHGRQFMSERHQRLATTYYAKHSGAGLTLLSFPRQENMHVGVVGLGTGTLATYGKPGDTYRFYEINPYVVELADEYFTYLKNCEAEYSIQLGDARLTLEREEPQQFDVLVLDAFSSDAIPVHLLTVEAFEVYIRHLKPDGVLCVHISNRHLDLAPVVAAASRHIGWTYLNWLSGNFNPEGASQAHWVLVTKSSAFQQAFQKFTGEAVQLVRESGQMQHYDPEFASTPSVDRYIEPWTDDHSNLFELLR